MLASRQVLERSRPIHYTLREEGPDAVVMLCGGEVTVFVEVCQPACTLLIVGRVHFGWPLAELSRVLDCDAKVVDVKPYRATAPMLGPAIATANTYTVQGSWPDLTNASLWSIIQPLLNQCLERDRR